MGSRIAKQIVYALAFILIILLAAFAVYYLFLKPSPTCFDGKQNQGEEGIDCGGPCGNVCLGEDFRQIEIAGKVKIFYPEKNKTVLLAKIQNPNADISAEKVNYNFEIYDKGKNLIKKLDDSSFIYNSEVKYIAEFLDDPEVYNNISVVRFSVNAGKWIKSDRFFKPNISVLDKSLTVGGKEVYVSGRIINNDSVNIPNIFILSVFKDRYGNVIGVSKTRLDDVSAGESRSFKIFHPAFSENDISAEIIAYARRPVI